MTQKAADKTHPKTSTPLQRSKYQIFPPHPPARHEALKTSIAHHGVENATTWDEEGNLLDGWEREAICEASSGITCPRDVRHFDTEADKFRFILTVNAHRRPSLSQKQKRLVIAGYLKGDAWMADNTLADALGVSRITVARVRRRLEESGQLPKMKKTRGKDGKLRPIRYTKRIITNTPNEFKKALASIKDLPDNCAGKTIDVTTARRRARRERSRKVRAAKAAESYPLPDGIQLHHCPFQKLEAIAGLKPASVKAMLTDIPYEKAWLDQVADLGRFAARILTPGGLLLVMTGIQNLDTILVGLGRHLDFKVKLETVWGKNAGTPSYLDNAGVVISSTKPIWVFSKGPFTKKVKVITPIGPFPQEKDWHPHQQPLDLFKQLVREFTDPGDLIVDPCGGGFTTALAAYFLGRRCISCDIDENVFRMGTERLNKAMRGEPDRP